MKRSILCLISIALAVSLSNLKVNAQPINDASNASSSDGSAGGDGSSEGQELTQTQEAEATPADGSDTPSNTSSNAASIKGLTNAGTLEAQNPADSDGSDTGTSVTRNTETINGGSASSGSDNGNSEDSNPETSNNTDGTGTDLESQLPLDPVAATSCSKLQEGLLTNCNGADVKICERVVHSEDVCGTRIRCVPAGNSQACQAICVALKMIADLEGMTSEDMFTSIRVAVRTDTSVEPKKMRQVNFRKVVRVFSQMDFSDNTKVNKIVIFARSTKSCSSFE